MCVCVCVFSLGTPGALADRALQNEFEFQEETCSESEPESEGEDEGAPGDYTYITAALPSTPALIEAFTASDKRKDAYWQTRPFITALQASYRSACIHRKVLSIDENARLLKERHRAKQYNPKKPIKWGLNDFVLAEAATGYAPEGRVLSART